MNICVYCSAKDNIATEYKLLAHELGQWIAQNRHALVFGGATGGLMSVVSQAVRENSGEVIGVVPDKIIRAGRKSDACTQLYTVSNMCERKQKMKDISDCFVCLPGSYGTLDEMMDVIASGTVGEHRKPIYIINHKGFYNHLQEQVKAMKELNFIPQQEHYAPVFVDTLTELFSNIHS